MLPASRLLLPVADVNQDTAAADEAKDAFDAFAEAHNGFQSGFDVISLVEGWHPEVQEFYKGISQRSETDDAGRLLQKLISN